MADTDIQITICGSAGDGTIAAGEILKKAMAKLGYHVIAFDIYPAEIRGFGKCVARTRISTAPVFSPKAESDVLVSLDDSHTLPHVQEVCEFGAVIYEGAPLSPAPEGKQIPEYIGPGHLPYRLNMRLLSEAATHSAQSRNIVVLGFLAAFYGMQKDAFIETLDEKFRRKAGVAELVKAAFEAGYAEGKKTMKLDFIEFGPAPGVEEGHEATIITGNAALVRGCMDAGIDTFFGYPITPASSILEQLAIEMPKAGGRVLQTEDEISAISATIGAGYAGSRAATATSGPGLSLMVEMLGLGVMAEVPCSIFVSQRGGPSTGLPTKTEQSDLNLAVYGGAGDAQRIVIAPTNVAECYHLGGRSFELAETFQTPVITLLDLYLSNRFESVVLPSEPPFNLHAGKGLESRDSSESYMRYQAEDDFISARALPGEEGGIHTVTGLEHNLAGRPTDRASIHSDMSEKRHRKLLGVLTYPGLNVVERFGDDGRLDVGIVAWGSTFGEALEAMRIAREEGIRCAALKVVMLVPFPMAAVRTFLADCRQVLVPELNYEAQFARLLTANTGREVTRLTQVTGEPMPVADIVEAIRGLAGGGRRVVAAGDAAAAKPIAAA